MKTLALIVALISAAVLAVSFRQEQGMSVIVPLSGFALAAIVWAAARISVFLRVFVVMYALGYVLILAGNALASLGLLPNGLAPFVPAPFMATAIMGFAALVWAVSHLPAIRTVTKIADPYFSSSRSGTEPYGAFGRLFGHEGRAARVLLGVIIAENFVQVALQVRLSIWSKDLFNALQQLDETAFWFQIFWIFVPLLVVWIVFQMINVSIGTIFEIRWREWMTSEYFTRWLDDGTHYKMSLIGAEADNPDQRIASDISDFITSTIAFSILLLKQLVTLVSFAIILWGLSEGFTLPGTSLVIPGFLFWVALLYAFIGSIVTHLIGRPLVRLNFIQQRREANFRFALARLREYGEQIALLKGATTEQEHLHIGFNAVIKNVIAILIRQLKLVGFTFSWGQISVAFPYIFMGSYFFAKKITLGQLQQGASAFRTVNDALSFFITQYSSLASFQATIDRLTSFDTAMGRAEQVTRVPPHIETLLEPERQLFIGDLALRTPQGRDLLTVKNLVLRAGQNALLIGPSGAGKSTLFRAIAGIWPYGEGKIALPDQAEVMLLPQKPYVPAGSLRDAISYPKAGGAYDDDQIAEVLKIVQLTDLASEIDTEDAWGQRLSGGELQRLAIGRALLAKPDWLLLDEATSAVDEPLEALLYDAIEKHLPQTTVISTGHRSTLRGLHDRHIEIRSDGRREFYVGDLVAAQ